MAAALRAKSDTAARARRDRRRQRMMPRNSADRSVGRDWVTQCLPASKRPPSAKVKPPPLSSYSLVGPRMTVSFGVELPGCVIDGAIEIFRSCERLMSEVVPLQVAPDRFNVVELWGVFRQPLDREPMSPQGERGAACFAGVDRTVVEDKYDGLIPSRSL